MGYLYTKALHVISVISWFAGLFYLPRLFVNLAMAEHPREYERLMLMARKLYRFMHLLALMTLLSGVGLWLGYGMSGAWLHAKLTLVLALVGYHLYCGRIVRDFAVRRNQRSHVWYRVFNEVPTLLMFAIVILAVVKPF